MEAHNDFTEGNILTSLLHFVVPVLFALFLQAMYGAVDLLVVGQFASSADVSAVATGSQLMQTVTNLISSLATGTTVLLGQKIGEKKPRDGSRITGASLCLFGIIGLLFTVGLSVFAGKTGLFFDDFFQRLFSEFVQSDFRFIQDHKFRFQ